MGKDTTDRFVRVGQVLVDHEVVHLMTQLGLADFGEAMAADVGERLDKPGLQSWRRRDRLRLTDSLGQERTFYLKRIVAPPPADQWARVFSGSLCHSTAWVEWDNIRRLNELGVPTMRAVLFGEKMRGPWEKASLLCTEQVAGESLERWLPVGWQETATALGFGWRKGVVEQLAGIIRRMHAGRLCHRDLYTAHIFVDICENGQARFCLIDLQRMVRLGLRKKRWYVKDLAALAASAPVGLISRTDRMRFLLAYLQPGGLDGKEKRWWRAIEAKGARMMKHHHARMQRLTGR